MSVGKNSFGLAPYYQWETKEGYGLGLDASEYICGAAGTAIAVVAGNVQAASTTTRIMQYTENGISWSPITSAPNTTIVSMAYGNGVFVAVGAAGVIYSAQESAIQTWTSRTKAGAETSSFSRVQYISDTGYFYAWQTSNRTVQYSSDGTTWTLTAATSLQPSIPTVSMHSDNTGIAYVNKMHIFFTGATSATSSDRYFTFKDISSTSYSVASGTSWAGFPTDAGGGEWYVCNVLTLASRIGWGSSSAVGVPALANINSDFNLKNFIPIVESTVSSVSNGYVQFSTTEPNPIDVYKTDGYYQVIGSATYSAPNWSSTQFGIGHHLFSTQDIQAIRREFIPGSRTDTVSDARRQFSYRVRFAFKGSQYLIIGGWRGSTQLGGSHRNYVVKGSRGFRPVRTTIDYRY